MIYRLIYRRISGVVVMMWLAGWLMLASTTHAQTSPTINPTTNPATSALEKLYTDRTGTPLYRLGADVFGQSTLSNNGPTLHSAGTTPDGDDQQILSVGDRVKIWLRGGQNREEELAITSDGTLILRDLPPLMAQGENLATLRQKLRDLVKQQYPDTDAYITLAGLRPINIQLTGAVARPGPVQIPANSDILTAIRAGGGITALGSHRALILTRSNGTAQKIDLYPLLQGGGDAILLRDGDRVDIGPVGRTIALSGAVKNPAIIEAPPHETLMLADALDLVGGMLVSRGSQLMLGRIDDNGREQQTRLDPDSNMALEDGDIITVTAQTAPELGGVRISIAGMPPRAIPLDDAPTLRRLLDDPAIISQNLYPLCAVIRRQPSDGMAGELIAFAPAAIRGQSHDRRLEDRDEIILFRANDFPLSPQTSSGQKNEAFSQTPIDPDDRLVADFLKEQVVMVTGAVRRPGQYPVGGPVPVQEILASAGGTTLDAAPHGIEILYRQSGDTIPDANLIPAPSRMVQAGDAVRVAGNPRGPTKSLVHLAGAVRFPGDYPIQPGEMLSSVLKRAGGLIENAYPLGAVFTRVSEQKNEQARYLEAARQLDAALSRQLSTEDKPNRDIVDTTRALSRELRQSPALGRIAVTADPDLLASNPDLDIVLEDGDSITFPQRAPIVRVMGEVQSPATLQFVSGKKPHDYLREAGGTTALADPERTFVLLPDGRSQPLAGDGWQRQDVVIVPGATLIVPRDAQPIDNLEMTSAVGNIIGQIAITAAAIASIHNNND